jgi:hypothetical protein
MRTWEAVGILTFSLLCLNAAAQTTADKIGLPEHHCSVEQTSLDGTTFACMVWNNDEQKFSNPTQIEIYRDRRLALTIETDAPIREWHFWDEGKQLSVHVGEREDRGTYELFDLTSGKRIGKLDSVSRVSELPQWAIGGAERAEIDDESVPEGPAYSEQRSLWIAKVVRQVGAISPGMTRTDLLRVFTTEGGLSTREQQTYVLKECRYIKVDVVFSPANSHEAEDRIVRISRPYLAFSIYD